VTNDLASWTPASDTHEIRSSLRGYALTDLPTVELGVLDLLPDLPPVRTRWSLLARVLTGLLLADVAGVLYVAVTS
jgi:hypothetical protein